MKSEDKLQSECFQWAWNTHPQTRGLLFAVPNGGKRDAREANKFKATGVVPGIPDMLFLWKGVLYPFEFKTEKGVISKVQYKIHLTWNEQGVGVRIVRTFLFFKAAIEVIIFEDLGDGKVISDGCICGSRHTVTQVCYKCNPD